MAACLKQEQALCQPGWAQVPGAQGIFKIPIYAGSGSLFCTTQSRVVGVGFGFLSMGSCVKRSS